MAESFRANGPRIECMAAASLHGLTVAYMRVSTRMTKRMAMAFSSGLMGAAMRANGERASSMGLVFMPQQMANLGPVNGRMAVGHAGQKRHEHSLQTVHSLEYRCGQTQRSSF